MKALLAGPYGLGADVAIAVKHGVALIVVDDTHQSMLFIATAGHHVQVVATLVGALTGIAVRSRYLKAFVIVAQHIVDHASHGICAIGGGCTAGQDLHPLYGRAGDGVDVDERGLAVGERTHR